MIGRGFKLNLKCISILIWLSWFNITMANDGAYFATGNQLIPINETDIEVRKEILSLKKVNNEKIEVTVYYEFYNPNKEKEITVGFEAFAPYGDVDGTPKKGLHPYMRNFTVNMNANVLDYKVAYVYDSLYSKNGKVESESLEDILKDNEPNYPDFFYVYHFKAVFKKGINIVRHTYEYDVSGGVDYNYYFEYVLTAANRWGNGRIDDFTLNIDMGEFENYKISKSFFKDSSEWQIKGIGKYMNLEAREGSMIEKDALDIRMQKGNMVFKKKKFTPSGELFLYSFNYYGRYDSFDSKTQNLPFPIYFQDRVGKVPVSSLDKKILRNWPFARRGYVFKNKDLKNYFEKQSWYIPNPTYRPNLDALHVQEQEWLLKWE